MKAILISDHAIWCALMMNGIKKIEVRKGTALYKATQKLIDEYGFAEFYVYCTKGKSLIYTDGTDGKGDYVDYKYYESYKGDKNDIGSGKVVFKFRCYKVEEVKFVMDYIYGGYYNTNSYTNEKCFERDCCLTVKELDNYINKNNLNKRDNVAYALHISSLEIFDRPKPLWHFHRVGGSSLYQKTCKKALEGRCNVYPCVKAEITKAPQSWCYVEGELE